MDGHAESTPRKARLTAHVPRSKFGIATAVATLAIAYVAAARLGLRLDPVSGFATLVWAPTGLSLAALLLLGPGVWPGVAIGAFAANALTGAPIAVALGIAAGNTAEAVLAAYLLRRVAFRCELDRIRDVLALITLAALVSTAVSATAGVASLAAGGMAAPGALAQTWRAWWVGDAIGALIVAPVILVWMARDTAGRASWVEACALGAAAISTGVVVFFGPVPWLPGFAFTQAYLCFPVLIWAALRFGPRGAASISFLVSAIAIAGTTVGNGPFVSPLLNERLFSLQAFMGIAAATFLLLGAASAERARALAELQHAVESARAARDAADAANRSKSQFLAAMSHELRTPLNAIGGYVDLIDLGIRGPVSEAQKEDLARIRASQHHLLGLIGGVLDLSRIEAGKVSYDITPITLDAHLRGLEELVAPQMMARRLSLTYEWLSEDLIVRADAEKLRQIMLNLLSNAIRHSPPEGEIRISARLLSDSRVEVVVSDEGTGIPEDRQEVIFEPFVQLDRSLSNPSEGIGLGLAVSRDLARGMGGELSVVKGTSKGASVALVLPAG